MKNILRRYRGSYMAESRVCSAHECTRFSEKDRRFCPLHGRRRREQKRNPTDSEYVTRLIKEIDEKLRTGQPLD